MAALLTPRPPELLVLNEPETSLHPDLLPALAEERDLEFRSIELSKDFGQTVIEGQGPLGGPAWRWAVPLGVQDLAGVGVLGEQPFPRRFVEFSQPVRV